MVDSGSAGQNFVIAFARTGAAEDLALAQDFAPVVDAFAALFAQHTAGRMTRAVSFGQSDADVFDLEKLFVGECLIGFKLLGFFGN